MQTDCRRPLILVASWGLLSVWLFFGSLALAETMNLVMMTTTHEEYALSQLASGLKPDVPMCEGRMSSAGTTEASTAPSIIRTEAGHHLHCLTVQDLPALRLHQRVSVYRI